MCLKKIDSSLILGNTLTHSHEEPKLCSAHSLDLLLGQCGGRASASWVVVWVFQIKSHFQNVLKYI